MDAKQTLSSNFQAVLPEMLDLIHSLDNHGLQFIATITVSLADASKRMDMDRFIHIFASATHTQPNSSELEFFREWSKKLVIDGDSSMAGRLLAMTVEREMGERGLPMPSPIRDERNERSQFMAKILVLGICLGVAYGGLWLAWGVWHEEQFQHEHIAMKLFFTCVGLLVACGLLRTAWVVLGERADT